MMIQEIGEHRFDNVYQKQIADKECILMCFVDGKILARYDAAEKRLIYPCCEEEDLIYLPVVGEIAAGHEHFMEEDIIDTIGVSPSELHPKEPGKYFFLRVSGDSMIGADIYDGNAVLIRRMSNPRADLKNGDVVACMLHGENATLKTYYRKPDGILLHPENPEYEDIFIPHEEFMIGEARIIGKMVSVREM